MDQPRSLVGGIACLDFINTTSDGDAEIVATDTAAAHRQLGQFRTSLRRLLRAEALGRGADPDDLAALNRVLVRAGGRRGIVSTVRGYGWGWIDADEGIERALWPIAFSAARLLEGPDLGRLKGCDGCGRLFIDGSRNRTRRWCDMQACGNRAKVARHRARKD